MRTVHACASPEFQRTLGTGSAVWLTNQDNKQPAEEYPEQPRNLHPHEPRDPCHQALRPQSSTAFTTTVTAKTCSMPLKGT